MAPEAPEQAQVAARVTEEGRTDWAEEWMAKCKQLGLAGGQLPLREGAEIRAGLSVVGRGVGGVLLGETDEVRAAFPEDPPAAEGDLGLCPA